MASASCKNPRNKVCHFCWVVLSVRQKDRETGTPVAGMGMFASVCGTVSWDTPNSKKRTRKDTVLAPR